MNSVLDDITFLGNSENRLDIFTELLDAPRRRDELLEQLDASRVTINRILRDLEARGWIEHSGDNYVATPLGTWVCEEFCRLVEELEAERRLRTALQWFPSGLLTFDVRCLRDAEVILIDESDTTELLRRTEEFHRSGEYIRLLVREHAPELIENMWEVTVSGDTRLETVYTPEILNAITTDRPTAQRFREMLQEDAVECFVHKDVPLSIGIVDGFVGITLTDPQGVIRGGIGTDHETVRDWAIELFETHKDDAELVEPDTMTL